jgi:hypothetical protein
VTDTTVMESIGKVIIHPAIFKKQDSIIEREIPVASTLQYDNEEVIDEGVQDGTEQAAREGLLLF